MASKKITQLCNLEWVMRARSSDEARPILCSVYATETELVATDGHRMHVAPNAVGADLLPGTEPNQRALPPGTWLIGKQAGDVHPVEGNFPNYAAVMCPGVDFGWKVADIANLTALCRAAIAGEGPFATSFKIAIPSQANEGEVIVRGDYLKDVLDGMSRTIGDVYVATPKPLSPVVIFQPDTKRRAVVMPIRMGVDLKEQWGIFRTYALLDANTTKIEDKAA